MSIDDTIETITSTVEKRYGIEKSKEIRIIANQFLFDEESKLILSEISRSMWYLEHQKGYEEIKSLLEICKDEKLKEIVKELNGKESLELILENIASICQAHMDPGLAKDYLQFVFDYKKSEQILKGFDTLKTDDKSKIKRTLEFFSEEEFKKTIETLNDWGAEELGLDIYNLINEVGNKPVITRLRKSLIRNKDNFLILYLTPAVTYLEKYYSMGDKFLDVIEKQKNRRESTKKYFENMHKGSVKEIRCEEETQKVKKYQEIITYLFETSIEYEFDDDIFAFETETLQKMFEYVKHDTSLFSEEENVIPQLAIRAENPEYISEIERLTDSTKNKLYLALDIACKNYDPETKKNYSTDYFKGLRKTLETDYDNIGKWADAIISGLKEVARTGRSLDEVMGR
ncbi:hypothetical protein HOK51_03150 [Candidatus Woesearchaeota archaeon]|jgi:hypothetical protein|nr:hypothetical protein [Candidatus Woesearchaeota archaeon]MBT6518816.1 hypothetical protein [Candidatus Woesearchaeota archaeon]MBT7367955.1 hypothetical protein [Candidatus Woesearchaeota archaeon]